MGTLLQMRYEHSSTTLPIPLVPVALSAASVSSEPSYLSTSIIASNASPSTREPASTLDSDSDSDSDSVLDTSELLDYSYNTKEELQTEEKPQSVEIGELREYMQTHSLKGNKMSVSRQPFVGEITSVPSPVDPDVEFGIRRIGNKEYIAHRNLSSKIRYIPTDGDDSFVSEKDYPVGDMSVSTILLALASWNIEDPNGNKPEITRDNLLSFTKPEELDFLYDKVLELNPILTGKDKAKNS